ncbi:MAG: zinc ribbon domain-containing protein [Lachnospiraceae bacterium]|nr:zinc ribbon domain-containing protein [Lachnospiraceae bacterium]MBP1584615.1 zinc ribbon domain-containing protein [Lachnospiraceae bacterium]
MAECKKCGVHITDDTDRCPFCRCVLEDDGIKGENVYPDTEEKVKFWRIVRKIILFLSLCAVGGMVIALYMGADIFNWTVVVALILLYVNVSLYMSITGKIGYMFKTLFLTLLALLILIGIDYFTGYNRWSFDYTLPSGIIFLNVVCVLLMIINRRNWQSYISFQLFNIFWSAVIAVMLKLDIIRQPVLVIIAVSASVLVFLGTLIFGGRRASDELKRRFFI